MSKKFSVLFLILLLNSRLASLTANEITTNPYRVDGFGAQFQKVIWAIVWAESQNLNFLYTPFHTMEHNYNEDPDFLKKKEWLVNLIDFYPNNLDINLQKKISTEHYIEHENFFEKNMAFCAKSNALRKIKERFRLNKNKEEYYKPNTFNIAIHIRRPNPHDSRIDGTNIPDEFYVRIVDELRNDYKEYKPQFHIFSQGDESHFENLFKSDDIHYHINATIEDSFTSLVLADVLVTSASSFSYTAGLLSDGIVYYVNFWHPPFPHWIEIGTYRNCKIITE